MRVLLVTDDDEFADRLTQVAASQGLPIARASSKDDLDLTAKDHASNVVALDARKRLGRTARTATAFATLHPSIAVVVVAPNPSARALSGLRLVASGSAPERLLDDLRAAHLGIAG
jgi:hypothetical protein